MSSGSDPGSLSTIPEINSSEEQSHHFPTNVRENHNSHAPAMVGPAPQDFHDNELQLIFDVVLRAEELLPSAGTAVTALYAAHLEICNKQSLKTEVDQRKATLFFKLGSRTYADTLRASFEEWLRRMNCTIRFDDNEDSANDSYSDTNDDNFSSRSDHPDLAYDADGATDSDEDTSDRLDDDGDIDEEEGREAPREENLGVQRREVEAGPESFLERSAIAFENHRAKFAAVSNIQQWQARSSGLQMQLEMFHDAREADFIDTAEDRFMYWKDAAAELEEAPVSHIPSNVYSKRIETIACRTYEILTSKKILAQWRRQCAKQLPEPVVEPPEEEEYEEEVAGDLYLSKLAVRAHENLMKSRVFTQWSNRAFEEEDKARVALRAHEMGLKSKAFGVRPRLEVLAQALQHRMLSNDGLGPPADVPERPASAPVTSTLSPLGSPLQSPAIIAKSDEALPQVVDIAQDEPEDDERTMIARRHILRMRFFRAWAEYTHTHTEKVKDHVMHATFDSWRGKSSTMDDKVYSCAQHHEQDVAKITLQKWIAAASQTTELNARAEEVETRARVEGALKPWLAKARAGRRLEEKKGGDFWQWYNTPLRDVAFDRAASLYHEDRKKREAIARWRLVAKEGRTQGDVRQDWASRADYYRTITTTLRIWKARAREHAVETSMKEDAFGTWRQLSAGDLPHQQQMQSFAERADFFYKMTEILPAWQIVAEEASQEHQQLQEYSERANFYYRARDTVVLWRSLAKKRRKARFKEAHLEVRRRVKRGMGEYCIAQWRDRLHASYDRYEEMNAALEDAIASREYVATAETFGTWRQRAQDKTQLSSISHDTIKQRTIDTWRERHLTAQDMQFEAGEYRKNRNIGKALRAWNLNSLQISSRRHTVDNIREKSGRRLLRQGFETWHRNAADKLVPTQLPEGNGSIVEDALQQQQQAPRLQLRNSLISSWRSTATLESPPPRYREPREEAGTAEKLRTEPEVEAETPYAPTPGRPQLLLGSFGKQQTTTPLAPVPSRQAAWQARDSILGGSAIEMRANRVAARPKRNLRVSWAQ
ncbi:Sfi1 spindle body protein-domain-containing protein [Apiospora arundinis]|uniref:Sfi1 spindle body protein-domain-containing protein n=1 Tax=Apiospora arundinis TaxID=335852 RepID=A0ABR2IFI1_9PEZI